MAFPYSPSTSHGSLSGWESVPFNSSHSFLPSTQVTPQNQPLSVIVGASPQLGSAHMNHHHGSPLIVINGMCMSSAAGVQQQNSLIPTGHPSSEAFACQPLRYKTTLCRTFRQTNRCKYGSRCMFAHGVSDLRTEESNAASGLCNEASIALFRKAKAASSAALSSAPLVVVVGACGSSAPSMLLDVSGVDRGEVSLTPSLGTLSVPYGTPVVDPVRIVATDNMDHNGDGLHAGGESPTVPLAVAAAPTVVGLSPMTGAATIVDNDNSNNGHRSVVSHASTTVTPTVGPARATPMMPGASIVVRARTTTAASHAAASSTSGGVESARNNFVTVREVPNTAYVP